MNTNYNQGDLISHHGIAAIIKNDQGEILMQEHVKYEFWTIPVGKVKDDQDSIEALKEEVFEECNLQIEDYKELVTKEYDYQREGNDVTVIGHLYEVEKFSGEMKNLEPLKHKQRLFLSLEEIKKLPYLSDMTLLYLEFLNFKRGARI